MRSLSLSTKYEILLNEPSEGGACKKHKQRYDFFSGFLTFFTQFMSSSLSGLGLLGRGFMVSPQMAQAKHMPAKT